MFVKHLLDEETLDMMRITLSGQERKLSAEPVCDFCGDPKPIWVYRAEKMSTGETQDCWRWTACEVCSTLVDNNRWREVEDRIFTRLSKLVSGVSNRIIRATVTRALDEFHLYVKRI